MADRITEWALSVFRDCYPETDKAAQWDEAALRVRACFVGGFCAALTSSPWRPIDECGELEAGYYLVTLPGNRFVVAMHDGIDWWQHGRVRPTHVHRMGPIRGPGQR